MKKEIPPAAGIILVVVVVLAVGLAMWRFTSGQQRTPPPMPRGPIQLPPSQIGRPMPMGRASASIATPAQAGTK